MWDSNLFTLRKMILVRDQLSSFIKKTETQTSIFNQMF